MSSTSGTPDIGELVRAVYPALAAGDRPTLLRLLHPNFEGTLTQGLPYGIGGTRRGAERMIDEGWWGIGAAFSLRAQPEEWIPCRDGRLLVLGRYRGHARSTAAPVDAAFAHLWTAREGQLVGVWHLTDSAAWWASLQEPATRRGG